MKYETREAWLNAGIVALRPVIQRMGVAAGCSADSVLVPDEVMVSCGWPRGKGGDVIGQCFGKSWTADGVIHIFISPVKGGTKGVEIGSVAEIEQRVELLAILAHELVHACPGSGKGHGKEFKKIARAIGLEGKLTATVVSEGSPLHPILLEVAGELGEYPHSQMMSPVGAGSRKAGRKKTVELLSRGIDGYRLVISMKILEEHGYPVDPDGMEMVEKEKLGESDE